MMFAILLAASAPIVSASPPPQNAIDAERAFAADAQKLGQWTAFRKWSTADALMFVPQPIKAHDFLKARKDPPVAVFWWPGASFVSCDGGTAVNSGPWVREWGKSVGYFTTVWVRQPDGGWKWTYDAGDALKQARAEGGDIKPRVAACGAPLIPPRIALPPADEKISEGQSKDGSLVWKWTVSKDGARHMRVNMWTSTGWQVVVDDHVAAETP